MTMIEKLKKQYEIGQPIFEKLFSLSDKDLRIIIEKIIPEEYKEDFSKSDDCIRTLKNEKPTKVLFSNYESIEVDWGGILIKKEDGCIERLRKFDEFFKLDF